MDFRIACGKQTKFQGSAERSGHDVFGVDVGRDEVGQFGLFHPRSDKAVRTLYGRGVNESHLGAIQRGEVDRHPDAPHEHAVGQRVGHHTQNRSRGVAQRNVHGKARAVFQERLRPIQGVDQPKSRPRFPFIVRRSCGFFTQNGDAQWAEDVLDDLLGRQVRTAHQRTVCFFFNVQIVVAHGQCAQEHSRGCACGMQCGVLFLGRGLGRGHVAFGEGTLHLPRRRGAERLR